MGIIAKIKDAKSAQSGEYLKHGNHVVMVNKISESANRNGQENFIAELIYVSSDQEDVVPGTKGSFVKNPAKSKFPDSTYTEIKVFVQAVIASMYDAQGVERPADFLDLEFTEEDGQELISDDQPAAGVLLKVDAYGKTTGTGGTYTKYRWDVLSEAERKKAQEAAAKFM